MREIRLTKSFSFNRFMITRGLGTLCDQFLMFAVPLTILKETGSVSFSALAFVIEWIPRVLFFPIAGSLIDGLNLKNVLVFLDVFRAFIVTVALFALSYYSSFSILSTLMAFMSVCYAINFVCIEATIPNNLPKQLYAKAHSWIQSIEQVSQVAGPAFAVLVYASLNIKGILFFCVLIFLASAVNTLLLHINYIKTSNNTLNKILTSNKIALNLLTHDKRILYLCGMTWIVNIIFGMALAITPAIITQYFQLASLYLGLLQSSAAIFAIFCFFFIPKFSQKLGVTRLGQISLAIILSSGLLLAISQNYWIYVVGYSFLIAFDGGFNVYVRTMRSTLIPNQHLGKVMGIVGMINLFSIPLGGIVVSLLADYISLQQVIFVGFIISLFLSISLMIVGKLIYKYKNYFPEVN